MGAAADQRSRNALHSLGQSQGCQLSHVLGRLWCDTEGLTRAGGAVDNVYTNEQIVPQRLLLVPDCQRGYAWDRGNLVEFTDDLELLPPERTHYTGDDHPRCHGERATAGRRSRDRMSWSTWWWDSSA